MVQENELITLLLSIGAGIFLLVNRASIARLPSATVLVSAFGILLVARVLTVLEGLIWTEALNLVEHVCYASGAILTALWCRRVFGKEPRST